MCSADDNRPADAGLIERLLTDPGFRAAFRRNPTEACRAHGLDHLAEALGPSGSMHTLELRESKSSLAGVIMALTAEGIGFAEVAGLLGHGAHRASEHPGVSFAHEAAMKLPARAVDHAGSVVGAVPASVPGSDSTGASGAVAELLANPHFSLPPQVRSEFVQGDIDRRAITVLQDAVARHTIVVGDAQVLTNPVHAQTVDIVSVDGLPVGPANLAARDLLTEIAAIDPSVRPNQIGSPWPIQSPGFFSDPGQQARLRLTFLSSTDSQPAGTGGLATRGSPPAVPAAADAASSTPPARPQIAAVSDAATTGSGSSEKASTYVNPLPADAQIGRTDMGVDVDLKPGEPIVAIGDSRVLGVAPNWYEGQPYVALQLLNGPFAGHNYYVAEQIDVAVTPGQILRQGQVIGHYAASGTGIEIGWAGPNWEQTLAQAQGNTGDATHNDSPAGLSFHSFLQSLGQSQISAAPTGSAAVETVPDAGGQTPVGLAGDQAPVAPTSPVKPVTAVFTDLPRHAGRAFQRQTVEFRAVSSAPAPASPQHAAVDVADISGAGVSVTSPLLTSGQAQFAGRLAQLTGLNPRVISAWALAEESGGAAQARQAAGNFDWLNIGYFDSGPGQIAFDSAFKDPLTAAEQTARFLKGTWGGASSSIRAILATASQGPQQQIQAIASSDWASSHYGDGANLRGTYDELSDIQIAQV